MVCVCLTLILFVGSFFESSFVFVLASLSPTKQVILSKYVPDSTVVDSMVLDNGSDRLSVIEMVINYCDSLTCANWWALRTSLSFVAEDVLVIPRLSFLVLDFSPGGNSLLVS